MKKLMILSLIMILGSCQKKEPAVEVHIKNSLDFDRSFETIEIEASELALLNSTAFHVIDKSSGDTLVSQTIDYDGDGRFDVLLFQPSIGANAEKTFHISASEEKNQEEICYSRFVPERTDDYAWENNRVAFRTYGPTAQKMVEEGVNGGTLTSGIDAWLKRVEYPVINKWYEKYTSGAGTYHEDTGEGLDNFHVGASRGVGGIAFKTDTDYEVSENFVAYKTIANGPLRTVFELDYGTYEIDGKSVSELKTISLDYGHNLSKFSISIQGTDTFSAGLTLHDNLGETSVNKEEAWMSYWEPQDGSELGQGIVVDNPNQLLDFDKFISEEEDLSNLFARLKLEDSKAIYYAGFGWKKSGHFSSKDDWEAYLSRFSTCLQNPLTVDVKSED